MRELLWRLIDPSLGFGFVVRRAMYTQRVVRVLQAARIAPPLSRIATPLKPDRHTHQPHPLYWSRPQAMPAFAASTFDARRTEHLARMVSTGREVFLPRYRALSHPHPHPHP